MAVDGADFGNDAMDPAMGGPGRGGTKNKKKKSQGFESLGLSYPVYRAIKRLGYQVR